MPKKTLYKKTSIFQLSDGQFVFVVADNVILYSRNYGRSFIEYPLSVSGCIGGNIYVGDRFSYIKAVEPTIVKSKQLNAAWITKTHSVANVVKVADGNRSSAIQCVLASDRYIHKINTDGSLPTAPAYDSGSTSGNLIRAFTSDGQYVAMASGRGDLSLINNTPAIYSTSTLPQFARLLAGDDYFLSDSARVYKRTSSTWNVTYYLSNLGSVSITTYGAKVSDGYGQMRSSRLAQNLIIADSPSGKVFLSNDKAVTFSELIVPGMSNPFLADLSETAQHLYVASKTHGLFVSNDYGATWNKRLDAMNFKNLYVEKMRFELILDEFYGNI